MAPGERWPPVYDADDLVREIRDLTARSDLATDFFEWRRDRSVRVLDSTCQGDVVHLAADVPLIAENGEAVADAHPGGMWLVIGNTCDFVRVEVPWTQVVPIVDLGPLSELDDTQRNALRRYTQSRRFSVPPWSASGAGRAFVADLVRPVAVDKRTFDGGLARVDGRMSRAAWILLNACLVRFIARDDGRYD